MSNELHNLYQLILIKLSQALPHWYQQLLFFIKPGCYLSKYGKKQRVTHRLGLEQGYAMYFSLQIIPLNFQ